MNLRRTTAIAWCAAVVTVRSGSVPGDEPGRLEDVSPLESIQ